MNLQQTDQVAVISNSAIGRLGTLAIDEFIAEILPHATAAQFLREEPGNETDERTWKDQKELFRHIQTAQPTLCVAVADQNGRLPDGCARIAIELGFPVWFYAPNTPAHGCFCDENGVHGPATNSKVDLVSDALLRSFTDHAEQIALEWSGGQLTYGELDAETNRLARYLIDSGMRSGDTVALHFPRGVERVLSVLAAIKAGVAWLPLDPAYPMARRAYMVENAGPALMLEDAALTGTLPCDCPRIIFQDRPWADRSASVVSVTPKKEDPAYVIYTSGTTGTPKGAVIPQRGLANLIAAMRPVFDVSQGARILQFAPFGFDAFVFEISMSVANGGTLVIPPEGVVLAGPALFEQLANQHITHATLPQTLLHGFEEPQGLDALTCLVLAGETPAAEVVQQWGTKERRLFNAYGPTEASVWASTYLCSRDDPQTPIGSPPGNTSVFVLDNDMHPCAVGQPGEIFIAGDGVATGYLGLENLTHEKFPVNPFHKGSRLYATGDRGLLRGDGMLEFLGRNDYQVKLRGHRIELPEIEKALQRAGAREAVVLAKDDNLIGFVTGAVEIDDLLLCLRNTLPSFMIPGRIERIDSFPQTSNGKIDRSKLAPTGDVETNDPPQGEFEEKVAGCWAELLNLDLKSLGRKDNFFDLGGHSLTVARYQIRHREIFGRICQTNIFVSEPTITGLAKAARQGETAANLTELIGGSAADGPFPLSEQQRSIWLLEKMSPGSLAYNAQAVFRINGRLDPEILRAALDEVVVRHEVFRTEFIEDAQGVPWQNVRSHARAQLDLHDLLGLGDTALSAYVDAEVAKPFSIDRLPLVRWILVTLDENEYALVNIEHHLVHDGWSANLSLRELLDIYDHLVGHQLDMPAAPPAQFRDYVAWLASDQAAQRMKTGLAFWENTLEGANFSPPMLTDFPRPKQQNFEGEQLRFAFPDHLLEGFESLCQSRGVTLYTGMMAALSLLVGRYSDRDDVLIGTTSANRQSRASENMLGMFVNTLAIRNKLDPSLSFCRLLDQTQTVLADAFEFDNVPFEQLVRALNPERSATHNPIFQVAMSYHSSDMPPLSRPDFDVDVLAAYSNKSSKFDWEIVLMPEHSGQSGHRLTVIWTFANALFKAESIKGYWENLKTLIAACIKTPEQSLGLLPLMASETTETLLESWNQTTVSDVFCLHEMFEKMVLKSPQAIAVSDGDQQISYDTLNKRANGLARHLQDLGIGPEKMVAVLMDRSVDMIVAMLATLKAGGAYLPLDIGHPAERLQFILADAQPTALVRHDFSDDVLIQLDQSVPDMQVVDFATVMAQTDIADDNLACTAQPGNLAYVIFTSGSTGKPKGVMIEHKQAARLFSLTGAQFEFSADDVWSWFHSFAFDFSVWEIWGALLFGGRVVVVPHDTARLPDEFYQLLCAEGVTVLNQTPGAFSGLIQAQDETPHRLRQVIFGGDTLEISTLRGWFSRKENAAAVLTNMYGITETTVHVTRVDLTPTLCNAPRIGSPVGRKLDDLRLYILNDSMAPVPVGVAGEIFVGGAGVARGYLNRPDLTQERFLANPFVAGDRLYRTGDLARFDADGNVEFLGRTDYQISLRGYRIEPGEIEAQLVDLGAHEALVMMRKDTLLAYVSGGVDIGYLRSRLKSALPEYMVPAGIVALESFPLTANGKIDRNALPDPVPTAFGAEDYGAPQNPLEEAIIEVWEAQLKVSPIGRQDNFFELGGHSLMVIRTLNQLRQRGITISAAVFFQSPVPADLAQIASTGSGEDMPQATPEDEFVSAQELAVLALHAPGGQDNIQDAYPLSPFQEGALFHHLIETEIDPYVVTISMMLETREQLDAFLAAFTRVTARHDVLRTGIVWDGLSRPLQYVLKKIEMPIEHIELPSDGGDTLQQIYAAIGANTYRFDLRKAPLMKLFYTQAPEGNWIVVRVIHHAIDDNTSVKRMDFEIGEIIAGFEDQLPAPVPFKRFVLEMRQRGDTPQARAHFAEKLSGITEPTLLFGLKADNHKPTQDAHLEIFLDDELANDLRSAARLIGVSLATLCHAAFGLMLQHGAGQDKVMFGTVLSGRMLGGEGIEEVMGPMINSLPITLRASGQSCRDFVLSTATELLKLIEFEQTALTVAQEVSQIRPPTSLFGALFNYRNQIGMEENGQQATAIPGAEFLDDYENNNYPLTVSIDEYEVRIELTIMVAGQARAERISTLFQAALAGLTDMLLSAPTAPVDAIDLISDSERRALFEQLNNTQRAIPEGTVLSLLGDADPAAIALRYSDGAMSHADLQSAANRLAWYLVSQGIGPETRVGICLPRSTGMVVAVLAALKAGAAYVPLDPNYTVDYLAQILESSRPDLIIAAEPTQELTTRLRQQSRFAGYVLDLDQDGALWADQGGGHIDRATAGSAACVIYTRGSNGSAKGAVIEHKALVNLVAWAQEIFSVRPDDRMLMAAPLGSDIAVLEMLLPLASGASTVLAQPEDQADPAYLAALVAEHNVSILQVLPRMLEALLDSNPNVPSLRLVLSAGESLPNALLQAARSTWNNTRIVNIYGSSETTICSLFHETEEVVDDGYMVPIGRPIANTSVFVLNAGLRPVATGVAGDLYIGGAGLAKEYWADLNLTRTRFIQHPFETGTRLYHTGDRVRILPSGDLAFLGRSDFQIKLRGIRIEAADIESHLVSAGARAAIVLVGNDQLIAYVTGVTNPSVLMRTLEQNLPPHMVPAGIVPLAAFPVTCNGKIDRAALPDPDASSFHATESEVPRGEVEKTLAEIWCEVLELESIGRTDNFFALGGTSLSAIRVMGTVSEVLEEKVPLRYLFEHPTIAGLALALGKDYLSHDT